MMENTSRPTPPNVNEGCYGCGDGKDQALESRLVGGISIALCRKHIGIDPQKPIAKLSLQVTK
jgi:hypothetical protein